MSVTLVWTPTNKRKALRNGTSSTKEALEQTFGSMPMVLGDSALASLRAMSAASRDPAYAEIAAIIEQHGEIELSAEY